MMAAGLQPASIEAPCSLIVLSQIHCGSLPKAGEHASGRSQPLAIPTTIANRTNRDSINARLPAKKRKRIRKRMRKRMSMRQGRWALNLLYFL
ncbi:hypothetical protein EJ02DRAFT_239418 [Clathrospora elynae]|uniref:Uncharacterized protein n=1 Tax=Clathrospora elynae TaxID=706981 RepID=A0A6A5SJY4_9PLEO|nr:hypothetical protein EJ02DRAFT_239418 [Clathrospora elynae]